MINANNNFDGKIVQKVRRDENHWILLPWGTIRDSSGPSVPSVPYKSKAQKRTKLHSELKAIPDRFTPYSRFREIYNGKRCYRVCARDVCVGRRRCLPLFSSSSFDPARKKRACREKRCKTQVLRLCYEFSRIILFSPEHESLLFSLDTKKGSLGLCSQSQTILNYS